ncbi:MAG: hypothetical protein HYX92_10225 [Chloroflexi bacterium]|nr:hypothetical protein [Chloroflexota bacterium]
MGFPKDVWDQLRGRSTADIVSALLRDGFVLDARARTERVYRHQDGRRISLHYHTGSRCYGPGLLKALLTDSGWSVEDMKRLKLVK